MAVRDALPSRTANPKHGPLFDVDPRAGISLEVFFADRRLKTFGRCSAGWFWQLRRRLFGRRAADRPVCYELRSISGRAEYRGNGPILSDPLPRKFHFRLLSFVHGSPLEP